MAVLLWSRFRDSTSAPHSLPGHVALCFISSYNTLHLRYLRTSISYSHCTLPCFMPALLLLHFQPPLFRLKSSSSFFFFFNNTSFSISLKSLAPCLSSFSRINYALFHLLGWSTLFFTWRHFNNFPLLGQCMVSHVNDLHLVWPHISVTVNNFTKLSHNVQFLYWLLLISIMRDFMP